MKQLIILRHSEANGEAISEAGKQKTSELVKKFFSELQHLSTVIISAPSQRAKETASVVSKIMKGNIIVEESLALQGYGDLSEDDWGRVEKCITMQTADLVFTIMHRYETNGMANVFCKRFSIKIPEDLKNSEHKLRTLGFDDAYVLDIETKKLSHIYLGKKKVFID